MRHSLTLLAAAALLAAPALGQESPESAFRLFLAHEGVEGNAPLGGVSPTLGIPDITVLGGIARLYVWAQVLGDETPQKYISVGYNVVTTGNVEIVGASTWNYNNILDRWAVTAAGTLARGELMNVRMAANPWSNFGVADHDSNGFDLQYDPATNSTVIGWIEATQTGGEIYLQIGDITIIRTGGTYDDVYLGFGDENAGLKGNMVGAQSPIPEAYSTPEPASVLLLGLAGLALRRR